MKSFKRKLSALMAVSVLGSFCFAALPASAEETGAEQAATEEGSAYVLPEGVEEVFRAEYPDMPPYPDEALFTNAFGNFDSKGFDEAMDAWWNERRERRELLYGQLDGLNAFFGKSMSAFLGGEETKNHVYSPVNIYLALGLLAELTEGETREQILAAIGEEDLESLEEKVNAIWNGNYANDVAVTCTLAASLWMNDKLKFNDEVIRKAAESAYASVYRGDVASQEMTEALQDWLSRETGGLLKEQAKGVSLNSDVIIALATAIYFKAAWAQKFVEMNTEEDVFHAPSGDQTAQFMRETSIGQYWCGNRFSAAQKHLEQSGDMLFILPDEGVTPQELLEDEELQAFLFGDDSAVESRYIQINMSLPKFDVMDDQDIVPGLKDLGISNVFVPDKAEFSILAEENEQPAAVSQAKHAARVKVDEEGVEAAAFTVMLTEGAALPPEEFADFILDRPFIFVVRGSYGTPLFAGIVNTVE